MNVLVVVGDLLTRHGVVALLDASQVIEVVGVATNLSDGRALLREEAPDVVLVSARLPPLRQAAAPLLLQEARSAGARTIVLAEDDETNVAASLLSDGAGGWGWVIRDRLDDPATLLTSIERVHRGGTVIDDIVIRRLAGHAPRHPGRT